MTDIFWYCLRNSNHVLYTLFANDERRFYAEGEFEGYIPMLYDTRLPLNNFPEECMDLPTDGVFVFPHHWGTKS